MDQPEIQIVDHIAPEDPVNEVPDPAADDQACCPEKEGAPEPAAEDQAGQGQQDQAGQPDEEERLSLEDAEGGAPVFQVRQM